MSSPRQHNENISPLYRINLSRLIGEKANQLKKTELQGISGQRAIQNDDTMKALAGRIQQEEARNANLQQQFADLTRQKTVNETCDMELKKRVFNRKQKIKANNILIHLIDQKNLFGRYRDRQRKINYQSAIQTLENEIRDLEIELAEFFAEWNDIEPQYLIKQAETAYSDLMLTFLKHSYAYREINQCADDREIEAKSASETLMILIKLDKSLSNYSTREEILAHIESRIEETDATAGFAFNELQRTCQLEAKEHQDYDNYIFDIKTNPEPFWPEAGATYENDLNHLFDVQSNIEQNRLKLVTLQNEKTVLQNQLEQLPRSLQKGFFGFIWKMPFFLQLHPRYRTEKNQLNAALTQNLADYKNKYTEISKLQDMIHLDSLQLFEGICKHQQSYISTESLKSLRVYYPYLKQKTISSCHLADLYVQIEKLRDISPCPEEKQDSETASLTDDNEAASSRDSSPADLSQNDSDRQSEKSGFEKMKSGAAGLFKNITFSNATPEQTPKKPIGEKLKAIFSLPEKSLAPVDADEDPQEVALASPSKTKNLLYGFANLFSEKTAKPYEDIPSTDSRFEAR